MKKNHQEEQVLSRIKSNLKTHIREHTGLRQKSKQKQKFMDNKLSKRYIQEGESHNIYQNSHQTPAYQQSESSFQLDKQEQNEIYKEKNQNIQKVLLRLGLAKKQSVQKKNEELQIVVNNIVQNCIGTVDDDQNTAFYEKLYQSQYNKALKQKKRNGSVIVSELTDIQKLRKISSFGLLGVYKYVMLAFKKFSLICQNIVNHSLFQSFILIIIILNSIKMALDDPSSSSGGNPYIQNTFLVLYTLEMLIKVCAFGFLFAPNAYLKDAWNILDFIIVTTSLLPIVIDLNFSVNSLRAIRVLRPLKTITKVKSLKMIVSTLFYAFSLVMDSLYILIFVMLVFSIAGTQLFSGLLQNRCMQLATGILSNTMCTTGQVCSDGWQCARGIANPNFSINNFDTIIWSMLNVFQTLTLQGWSQIMIGLQQSYNYFAILYSYLIVFICQYVLLNMTLAILKYKYSQVKGNTIEEQQKQITQYEPSFLKKIGIFKNISKLTIQPSLSRFVSDSKIFVGCNAFFKWNQTPNCQNYDLTMDKLKSIKPENSTKSINFKKQKMNIQQLKNMGKVQQQKWDTKTLQFDLNEIQQQKVKVKQQQSEKQIKQQGQKEQNISQMSDQSDLQFLEEQQDEDSDDSLSAKSKHMIQDRVHEFQKKVGLMQSIKKIAIPSSNLIRSNKLLPELKISTKLIQNEQVAELDRMLRLIGQPPGSSLTNKKNIVYLPQVDLNQIQVQKLFERFNDLGEYKIKRIQKKNELNYLQINHKKKNISQTMKKKDLMKQIIEEADLDIKQLQLINQLSKKQMKCRIKQKQVLDQYKNLDSTYDITRVMASQKQKELQKKNEQILQNMNNLRFNIKYKLTEKQIKQSCLKSFKEKSVYRRNLTSQRVGLKIPQIIKKNQKFQTIKSISSQSKIKTANNTYLKLLQNHQIQQKIQLELGRIMQIFFRKEQKPKREEKKKISLIQQYKSTKQADIFERQGEIILSPPIQYYIDEHIFSRINMKQEQYYIYVKGFWGIFNVIRKKTLIFVNKPFYDNLMLLFVIANTIVLTLNGFVNTDDPPYSTLNKVFTIAFTVDLFLKIFAYGINFFGDIMNIFDSFVVCTSIVELTFASGGSNLSALRAVRILRAFRVLRITRLIRTLNYMKIVMSVISSVITQFIYIFMLLALFIFIYTLLGMQIFGGTFINESVSGIRQNFDTFFNAFFSVFQVLTVQNWNDIQTAILTSSNNNFTVLYLISWIFIGNWILLNLLQAILLDGFDGDSTIFNQGDQQEETVVQQILQESEKQIQKVSIDSESQAKYSSSDASLFMFFPDSPIRLVALKISQSKVFQYFIVFMIALSSLKLVIDTYITSGSQLQSIANNFDLFFNFVFIFESSLKIISQGLLIGQNAYLKDSWSKLDFFIVSTAVIDMSLGIDLKILKLFRTLRPLRIISRNPDMKIIISSLSQSMVGIFNVLIIIIAVFMMFGILGMNLLQGKLNYCSPSQLTQGNYGPFGVNQKDCQASGGVWSLQFLNFQNIMNSMMSLYVFSTRENWPFYTYTFIDATTDGPVKDNSQLMFMIFAIIIIFVCSYFLMDLLVGVLFMNFHQAQQKIRPKKLTDKQINWKNLQKIIVQEDPCFQLYLQPSSSFNKFFYNIIKFAWFDIFVTCCILGNIVVMMIATNDQSDETTNTHTILNFSFSIVFILQFVLKFLALGRSYFLSGWNVFDFFVVMASILDIIMSYTGLKTGSSSAISILPQIARIFRVLRVTKLLRMFKRFKGLQKLIQTFLFSIPALAKGLSIVLLFLFIMSVLASYLFSSILSDYSGSFSQIKNFKNFHSSFELLFIMTTGQNWYFYMYESILDGYVVCQNGSDCTQLYYLVFWIIYVFFSQKVFMQLFVLIVLDQFEANYINQNNPLGVFSLYEDDFRSNWIEITSKYHSEKIQTKRLIDLLLVLKQPLGLGKNQLMKKYEEELRENQKVTDQEVHNNLQQLDMKLKKNAAKLLNKMTVIKNRMYLGYHQTFYNFAKSSALTQCTNNASDQQIKMMQQMHKQSEQSLQKLKPSGNIYYYDQNNNQDDQNQPLNPIQLILFCQMIMKSWQNYSIKFHLDKNEKKQSKNKKDQIYNSLNNSCASDIEQAEIQKLQNDRKFIHRKAIIERTANQEMVRQIKFIPNIQDHYKNQKKQGKLKPKKSRNSNYHLNTQKSRDSRDSRQSFLSKTPILRIKLSQSQSQKGENDIIRFSSND